MDLANFHKVRLAVQDNAHPADESHAARVQLALHDALTASGLFDRVELGRTDDVDQLVIGLCRCAEKVLPWEAGLGVERLWQSVTQTLAWESHSLGCTESLMEFEGAVTVDGSGHYITVHLVAEPPLGWVPSEPADADDQTEADASAHDGDQVDARPALRVVAEAQS
jgi:hypothetical protein